MRFLKYLLVWVCVIFLLGSMAGYVYIRIEGKRLFEKQLTKFFGQPAQIEDIRYLVPAGIRFKNLKIQNILEVADVRLHLRIPFLLNQRFVIAKLELEQPVFHLVRYGDQQIDFGGVYLRREEEKLNPGDEPAAASLFEGITIDLLSINDGELMLVDLAVDDPVKYEIDGIKGKTARVFYPLVDQQVKFDVQGVIRGGGGRHFLRQAEFSAGGWLNWPARAMDMTLDIQKQAGLSARMTLKGKENKLQIRGRVEADIMDASSAGILKDLRGDQLGGVLAGALEASHSKVGLTVSMETRMDAFSFGLVKFEGEWQIPQRKGPAERLSPAALLGVIPVIPGQGIRK